MDNPSSFSLGITQLDATVQDISLGFVPATFDKQDSDWAENRSKHRKDPVTMKKLMDKAASKSKKSTSKASKKKFDDSDRPRLPKRNAIPRILNWSVQCIRPKYESFMSGTFTKHSYKNIQPTTDEVSRLDLSFSKDFKICDPTTYASTSDSGKLKGTAVELQHRVGTIAEEFGDFSAIPPREILMKAGFESSVSPNQPLKKRKTVMFDQEKQAVMDDDTSGCGHAVHHRSDLYREIHKDATDKGEIGVSEIQHHHHVEISVSPQSHQHKFVPSSSTQPEGTSKSSLDGDEIKNYINKYDEVGGTITDSIQSTVDTLLFGLSTPSTTKSLDVGASNKMIEIHWDLPDSQISPDFPDAQVRELQASKSKAPAKRERKKSRVLRSPYISKYGSGSKDAVDIDKEEKLKIAENSFCQVGNLHLDVIFYHLRKKSKIQLGDNYRYTTTSCFFKTYVEKTHARYYPAESAVDLSTQQDYAESIVVANKEDIIANIIQAFCMPVGLPWYMVDEERLIRVYDSLSSKRKKERPIEIQKLAVMLPNYLSDNGFYNKTERTDWPSLEAYKGKITQQNGLVNEISFDVDYVQNIPRQASDSLDCGVFVCAYAEILSEGLQVHLCGFDSACQRALYASLLWHYGVEKANEGYTSDNGDPPRPRKSVIEEIESNAIVTLE
ncbi:hypothetical protein CQW23_09273 [Capsicum baccatum]|uniref:Ubiquitin-like protease family profile domain-containing protein n=1 Tax=Capsicum baccatum TaxID=33114 RepID=A0A2G2WW88_CAPBA|nr:hypothetical protein CQW23_09273 [Capsicum baccatum]